MAKENKTFVLPHINEEINGTTYRATKLKLSKWIELSEFLGGVLGQPFEAILFGDSSIDLEKFMSNDTMAAVAALAIRNLNKENLERFVWFAGLSIESNSDGWRRITKEVSELYWPMHMGDMPQAFALFLKAQYADFFTGLKKLRPQQEEELPGQDESTSEEDTQSPIT